MRYLLLTCLLLVAGCRVGPRPAEYAVARWPAGITGEVRVDAQRYSGELLEVRDTAFVLASANAVIHIPFRAVTGFRFPHGFAVRLAAPSDFSATRIHTLKLHSRFPYGMPANALDELLKDRRQTAITRAGAQ